jgi:mRNA interferase HigB
MTLSPLVLQADRGMAGAPCRAAAPAVASIAVLARPWAPSVNQWRLWDTPIAPNTGTSYSVAMRIIALGTLRDFWVRHPDSREPLGAWYAVASRARWTSPADVKAAYRNASFLAGNRVVFNVKGNDYRLVVAMHYNRQIAYVRFVGTHREYDQIDAGTV